MYDFTYNTFRRNYVNPYRSGVKIGNYNEEFLTTPKKWNYIMNVDSDKTLYDIKCSNDITCLLFKNKSDIKNKDNTNKANNTKNEFEIQVNSFITEDMPLK